MSEISKLGLYILTGGPSEWLVIGKIGPYILQGVPDGEVQSSAIKPAILQGLASGEMQSSAIKPSVLQGVPAGEMHCSKLCMYILTKIDENEDIFDPPPPTIESQVTFESKIVDAGINDDWNDTGDWGLNATNGVYNLVWKVLYEDQVAYIEGFLAARAGGKAFKYTIPTESTEKIFKCKSWETNRHGGTFSMRAEFRQVFDLRDWN